MLLLEQRPQSRFYEYDLTDFAELSVTCAQCIPSVWREFLVERIHGLPVLI